MNYSSMQHYQGIPPAHESIAKNSATGGHHPAHNSQAIPYDPLQQTDKQIETNVDQSMIDSSSSHLDTEGHFVQQTDQQKTFDPHAVWQMLLSELALQMPSATFNTWVRDTWVVAYEDGEFIIGLPNAYARDWLENRLRNKIKRALSSFILRSVQVQFLVCPRAVSDPKDANATPLYKSAIENPAAEHHPTASAKSAVPGHFADDSSRIRHTDLPNRATHDKATEQVEVSASDSSADLPERQNTNWRDHSRSRVSDGSRELAYPNKERQPGNHEHLPTLNEMRHNDHYLEESTAAGTIPLNGQYTFETFIVGSHNKLAHAAAEAIAEKPGQSFNPLFVYGGVGLGKTHLLHSIGHRAKQLGHRMLYVSSEQFTNELIGAIRGQSTEDFRNKYRQVDILLIDDIQFISGKESTQEEFFHTFNHLHASGRQVVLTSDRPPKMLATLDDRLRSRFEGGLQTDIAQPDFETRVAILQSKANRMAAHVDHSVLMMVAERVDSNIRELEGALNRLIVQARLMQSPLTLQLATTILGNLAPERNACTPETLVRIVAEHFQLTDAQLCGRKRTKEIAGARQIAMYLLRDEHGLSLPAIGSLLGGRDHSTVRYGIEKVGDELAEDESLRQTVATLREKIYLPI